jgi:hypothetical protein
MRSASRVAAAAVCGALVLSSASRSANAASAIYLQNFSVLSTGGMTPLSALNWNPYYGNASTDATLAAPGNSGNPPNAMLSGGPSGASPGPNVNAAQVSGVTSDANGFVPLLSINGVQQMFAYTNEYTIDRTSFAPATFSWYAASGYAGDLQRLAVQIGGNWYASTSPISPPGGVIAGTSFQGGSQKFTTTFSTDASAWDTLNFAPGSPLTLGSALSSPLPGGNITGFGIYAQIADNSGTTNQNERTFFDTFEVDAITLVPEPTACALVFAGGAVLLRRRRGES